jgi:hypothetical protein
VLLLVVYLASMAPGVTLWDAGEFIAAVHTLGIPHPPGTPLFILIGKAWTLAFGWLPTAFALNLLSAVCTALSGALTARLVFRSTGQTMVAVAAAVIAGTMSSAWLNATETEVYAVSLLLSMAMIFAADQAGRTGEERWVILIAYLIALAVPLHLTALVAVPTAMVLAAERVSIGESIPAPQAANTNWRQALKTWNWAWVMVLGGVAVLAVAASSASRTLLVAGAILLALSAQSLPRESRSRLAVVVPLMLVALSALVFMLVRAPFDPGINQGDPSTLERWMAVITREQYAGAPHWPRQAPLWIQIANVLQYFDWQLALSLAPEPPLSAARGAVTLVGMALGVAGSLGHRRTDPRRWRAVAVLMLSGSIGVMGYLNLKPGPSIGWDILPDSMPHEPRERDYFFVLAFWAWAIWIAIGARAAIDACLRLAAFGQRDRNPLAAGRPIAGVFLLLIAGVPTLLNWRAVERRSEPGASLARLSAQALLASSPEHAVLFVAGDNDSYPLWYLQHVEKFRTDVTVVTIPIIPADWYRSELERRHGLRAPAKWIGLSETIAAIAADARSQGRTVVAAVSVDPAERAALGQARLGLRGWVWMTDSLGPRGPGPDVTYPDVVVAVNRDLRDADRRLLIASPDPVPPAKLRFLTPAERYMLRLLACPRFRRESAHHKSAADSLDSTCNFR